MNSCFENFVGLKRIMSDVLDRLVVLKIVFFSNSTKITQNNVLFLFHQIIHLLG